MKWRDWRVFAYAQGFIERVRSDGFGRTHEINQDWNNAYDAGRRLAARINGETS